MSAAEIIEQIKQLPAEEKSQVISFVQEIQAEARLLTPDELGALARKMVDEPDPKKQDALQRQLVEGFYGERLTEEKISERPTNLSGVELTALMHRLVESGDESDQARLREKIVAGFYGEAADA